MFAVPAIRALRRHFPKAEIVLLGRAGVCDLLAPVDGVDGLVRIEEPGLQGRLAKAWGLRCRAFGLGVILPESFGSALEVWLTGARARVGRSAQGRGPLLTHPVPYGAPARTRHVTEEFLEIVGALGAPGVDPIPRLAVSREAAEAAGRLLPNGGRGVRLGVVPGAAFGPAKRWPPERFADLARRFEGAEIVLFGSAEDRSLVEEIAGVVPSRAVILAGRTSPPVLAGCLAKCSLVVGNDTGPIHLAAAVGTPVVAIFGSTNPAWTGPRGELHRTVQIPVECAPCYLRNCDRGYACLRGISTEDVWRACQDLMGSPSFGAGRSKIPATGGRA